MNRTLYKVVFNKHRNCMMAVAENAKREGKNTADTQAAGILPNDIAGFTGFIHSISVISFSLSLLLGSALILTSPSVNAQDIVADKSAPTQQQPTIMQTSNGIPQANIQTPTAAGVSVNQYTHFNVDKRGAILNNSRRNVQTQLGGWIQGNPWLAGGEARVIVNQVNSANPSLLSGYIEVGGRRAEVVVANPAGIQVNGGGFINASRATLTTGQPQYQAGDLSGFKIRQGNVVIAGHGLDARDTDYTQILSRAVKIDAPVWGKDVRVLAGQNDVSADGSIQSSHSPAANTNSANSLYAIDTGALGGMYAGKITLISTDRDASVRNQGQLFASAGNVAVNAEGKLVNTGTIAATGENHAVSLHARNVHNSGTIASQDDANIHSQTLDNSGTVLSSGQLTVRNLGRLKNQNNGTIQATRLDMSTGSLDNTGNITQTGSQALDLVSTGKFDNSGKIGVSNAPQTGLNLNLSVIPQIPSTATGSGSSTVSTSKPGSNNPVSPTAPAKTYARGRIQTTGALDNVGSINAGGQIDITAKNSLENSGSLNAAKLQVSGDSFDNTAKGKLQAHDLAVNTQTAQNSGHLLSQISKINSRELHNAGEIAANNLTLIHSGRLSNDKKGNIRAAHLQLDTADLHNAGNILADSGTVTTNNNLRNTGKVSVAQLNTEGQTLDNTHGRIEAETVSIQSQQLTNQSGHITATEQLTINSRNVDNQNGKLLSANQAQLAVSDGLYNQHGEIATNRQLSIHDKNQNTLALNNADGTIQSAGNVSLQAKSLANNGTLTAGNKLDIALTDDFVVDSDLTAGNQLNLSTKGRLKNTHTLQAGHTLKLNAGNIDNQVTGKIIAGEQTNITSEQHVDNRGLINSNGLTHIGAGQTLTNTGTGKIYGDHIALDAQKLLNREETTEGRTKAGAIAARKRLDIGAKEIHNQEGALLSSEGIFAIGNRLDEQHHAAGMADTFVNGSASLEVQGDALMSVRNMQNINNHFKTETYLAKAEKQVRDYTVLGQNTYYQAGKDGLFDNSQGQKDQTIATFHLKNGSRIEANQWHVRDYHIETYKERIIENRPAHITVGGNLTVSGQDWLNKDSRIIVGGRIITDDLNQKEITNQSTTGKGRIDAVGTQWDSVTKKGWYSGKKRQRRTERNHTPYHDTQLFTHDFDTPASVTQQNAASPSFQPAASAAKLIDGASTAAVNGQRIHTGNVVSLNNATVTLPNSSLYTTHPDNKGWLVETDPQFADYRRWLGSDYMLKQLQLDPNHLHKRLGDGYYEQKLVNEQIHQLTGYRRLDGYSSDEEQFKALMDNGLTVAKTFGLTPGIALSAEQVARLTSDIVWMENQTVTLSDGSTQTVLAPKVYALARKGDLNTSGGLISAEQVLLKLQNGNLTNSGTIAGRQAVLIQARNINSNGNIQADQIGLKAEKSINVDGGQVQAGRLLTAQAQNINLNGTTQTPGNERNGNTAIDRMAGINVVGSYTEQVDNRASDGILSLHADNDINLNAATISNQVKGGTTQITAGNNLNLGTIRTEHRETYGALDDKNHRHVRQSAEVGSSIRTQNGAMLRAGNDLKIRQGELETEEGKTVLAAGRDVNISEGRQITELDAAVSGKSKGILSSTKTHDRYRFSHDEAVGSNIGGGKIIVAAGQDINVRGSNLISDNDNVLKAGRDIQIEAASNRHFDAETHEYKKSGLSGSFRDGVLSVGYTKASAKSNQDQTATTLTTSQVGSKQGDTVVVAERTLNTKAAILASGGDMHLQGRDVALNAGYTETNNNNHIEQKQSGLSMGITLNPIDAAKANYKRNMQGSGYSNSIVGKTLQRADAGAKASTAAFTPIVITGGRQKITENRHQEDTQAVVTAVSAQGNLNIVADGGSIRSEGTKLTAERDILLSATESMTLDVARNTADQHGSRKRSGFSIDNRELIPAGTFNDRSNAQGNLDKATGTQLSAGGIATLQAKKADINIFGSSIAAEDDVTLSAGRNINIRSSQNNQTQSERQITSGIGTAVISDTEHFAGWMKNRKDSNSDQVEQIKSQVGSLGGNVNMQAGGNYTQQVANVVAAKDINITAKSVEILADHNRSNSHQSERDVKIGTFAKVSSPLIDLVNAAEGAVKSKADDRTQALQTLAAGAQAYSAYNTATSGGALAKAEVGFGFKTANSSQDQSQNQSQANVLNAGGNLNIRSTEGNIHLQNTQAQAAETLRLDSAKDLILESGQSSQSADGKNSSLGASVGVGVSVGAQTGVYVYGEVGGSKGKNHYLAQTHDHTTLQANKIELASKGDTTLKGATATARRIDADVKGRLNIESVQDHTEQDNKQTGAGVRVQVSFGTAWEASGNFNQSKASGSSDSAAIQSGLFAGEGGYHVQANSVHLKGGAITSTAPKEQNELTAKRLTFENIQNQSSYSASNVSLSGSYGSNSPSKNPDNADFRQTNLGKAFARSAGKNGTDFNPGLPQYEKGGDNSTTYATLSEGRLNIGGKETTTQELGINSDSSNAHRAVAALPDLAKITEKQQIVAKATSDIVSATHTFSSNRQKTAAENKAKAEAEFEGRLKAQNDGSYEAYAKLDETERQKILINYSETYRKADAEAQNWGVGGKHRRALNASTTLATGLLGGQSELQSAVNAAAPYASEAIGRTFGHGENKNETAQAIGHFLLGAAVARVNGGNSAAGGAAAVAAEKAAEHLAQQYNDGKTAIDPQTGEFNANLLPEHIKEEIKSKSGVIASMTGAAVGGTPVDAQTGGAIGQNAVENNLYLTSEALKKDEQTARKIYSVIKEQVKHECSSTGRITECRQNIGRIIEFTQDKRFDSRFKDLKKESLYYLNQHPDLVASYLKAEYEKLDREDKSILHRYISPGAEIVSGSLGVVLSGVAGGGSCAETFGLGCAAALVGVTSSYDHVITGTKNFGKKASEQRPTITVQALKQLGLSEQAAEYIQFSLDLFSVGKSGAGMPKAKPKPVTNVRVIINNQAEIGKKLDYFLGKATGNQHNIDRSTSMLRQLESIGLPDNVVTRQYLLQHLKNAYADPSNIIRVQENGRVIRETLLTGPQGVVKLETIWDGNRLITGEIYGPTGRFRHGAK